MASAGKRWILILVENLPVPFDRRVWQQATTLSQAGFTVSVICPKGKGHTASYELLDGVHIYRHPLPIEAHGPLGYLAEYGMALIWQFWLALKVWRKHGFDIIQACNPPDLLFLVALPFKVLGKTFVFDHHDLNPELYEAKYNGRRGFFWKLLCLFEKCTFRLADRSIATNESYRDIALERGGMRPEHVAVIRSGPSLARMRRQPPNLALKPKPFLVGYLGVMGKQEGLSYLLEAARILEKQRDDVHYVCIGSGPELPLIQQEAEKLGVAHLFTFTGRIPDAPMLDWLNTADICVNPDEWNVMNDKSTMNKIMEYMALAKPIVQFDLKEGRVSAQQASLYAKPNDAEDFATKINQLLNNQPLREEMGQFGLVRVQNDLSWDHEAPKFLKFYQDMAN